MGSFIPPILTFTHFIMEVYSTLNAPLAYLSFLHILFFLPSPVTGRGWLVTLSLSLGKNNQFPKVRLRIDKVLRFSLFFG